MTEQNSPSIPLRPSREGMHHPSKRLASLDALRGFDMLMISGGGDFIHLLGGLTGIGVVDALANQFYHPDWNGFTLYDFIFPLFLFLAGTSLVISLQSGRAKGLSNTVLVRKVFRRMVILILLGILFKNAPLDPFDPTNIRFGSVLGRIGIATFLATFLYLHFSYSARLGIGITILITYFLALLLIPVPGFGAGDLSFEGNLVGYLDRMLMPGKLKQITYDELAMSTQLTAMCLTLFGTLAGETLMSKKNPYHKIRTLAILGISGICLGLAWDLVFPINKHLWSSSFVLLTAGLSFLSIGVFYWVIDVLEQKRWAFFFQVIGVNSLLIYLATRFIGFNESARLLFSGLYQYAPEPWHEVLNALGGFALVWLFLYFMYRNKIFLKV